MAATERGEPYVGVLGRTFETLAFATYAQQMGTGHGTKAELAQIVEDAKERIEWATAKLKATQGNAFANATVQAAMQAAQVTLAQETRTHRKP